MSLLQIEKLRPHQLKPINAILDNKDTMIIAPTSFGKSIIYLIPAVIQKYTVTIVIEPLLALMHDQFKKLQALGVAAAYLDSTQSIEDKEETIAGLRNGNIQILYIAPERLETDILLLIQRFRRIGMIVVDECHCVTSWGYSFRDAYLRIGEYIDSLKYHPVIVALSATALPEDRPQIMELLSMHKTQCFEMDLYRSNLCFLKKTTPSRKEQQKALKKAMRKYYQNTAIVFCATKHAVEQVAKYYHCLSPRQKNMIMERLRQKSGFQCRKADYFEETYLYTSDHFASQGVKLEIFRKKKSVWGLKVIVHPTLVLGECDRSALYQPKKKSYKEIVKTVDKLLETAAMPCSVDDMKLYRVDLSANLIFKAASMVIDYLRVIKKSLLLPKYHLEWFRENEGKAKDCKLANEHSYKQSCKSSAFFAYDKTAQLEMIEHFPEALIGKRVLRLEAQLRRKGMKKWVSKGDMGNNWDIIRSVGENPEKVLCWYLDRLQPVVADYVRYEDGATSVSAVKGKKTRERMLYLLRKTSDSRDLTAALEKLRDKYDLNINQCNTVLKEFKKLGISPITLRNDSYDDKLPFFLLQ